MLEPCHKKPGSCKSFDDPNESPDAGQTTPLLGPPFLGDVCLCKLCIPSHSNLFMKNCSAILTTKKALLPIPVGVCNPQGPLPQRRQPLENIKQHCLPVSRQAVCCTTETHGNVSSRTAAETLEEKQTSHLQVIFSLQVHVSSPLSSVATTRKSECLRNHTRLDLMFSRPSSWVSGSQSDVPRETPRRRLDPHSRPQRRPK